MDYQFLMELIEDWEEDLGLVSRACEGKAYPESFILTLLAMALKSPGMVEEALKENLYEGDD